MEKSRIAEERKKLGLSQEELASRLKISQKSISKYECGSRRPSYEVLLAMASIFGVTTDYLLGNDLPPSDDKGLYFYFFFDCWDDCVKRIRSLLDKAQISEEDFCRELGIDLDGEIVVSDLIKIAKKLDVSADYILGISEYEHISGEDLHFLHSLSTREKNIIDTFRQLYPDNQDIMVGELKKCLKEQRRESVAADQELKQAK